MKVTKAILLALFNRNSKGNFYITVSNGIMYLIPTGLADMIISGELESIQMIENGKLPKNDEGVEMPTHRPDPTSIVEKTRVQRLTERVEEAKDIVKLYNDNKAIIDEAADAAEKLASLDF